MRVSTVVQRQPGLGQTVTHKEQLAFINIRPSEFAERKDWIINPRKDLFPWLRMIANSYDMYEIKNLRFVYVPDCPTTVAGSLCMYIDYDPEDDNSTVPYSEMMSMAGAVSDAVYKNITLPFDLRRLHDAKHSYFCKGGDEPDRFNDVGRLWLRTQGPVEALNIGRLFVVYQIVFKDPEVPEPLMPSSLTARLKDEAAATTATVNATNPIGDALATEVTGQIVDAVLHQAKEAIPIVKNICRNGGCFTTTSTNLAELGIPPTNPMQSCIGFRGALFARTVGDDYVMSLGDAADPFTYYVVSNPAEYVNVNVLVTGTLTSDAAAQPGFEVFTNAGWEMVSDACRTMSVPSTLAIAAQPWNGTMNLFFHRLPTGPRIFLICLQVITNVGTSSFAAATAGDAWNHSYPYSQITITDAAPADLTAI